MPGRMPEGEEWGQWSARLSAECGPLAAAAWAAVRRRMGPKDEAAVVGLADLARELAKTPRTVRRMLNRLAAAGWLKIQRTGRASALAAGVASVRTLPAEHIESGQKCPIRADKSVLSERTKVSYQSGQKCPVAQPPLNNPPVTGGEQGRGEERAAPPPPRRAAQRKTATTTIGNQIAPPATLSDLVRRTAEEALGDRFPLREVRRQVESDVGAKVYALEELEDWLDHGGGATYPSKLKVLIPAHAAEKRRQAFAARLKNLAGLTRAVHVGPRGLGRGGGGAAGPPRVAEVVYRDPAAGLLVLEELVGGRPGASAEDLSAEIAALRPPLVGGAHERALRERLASVEAGRPDPVQKPAEKRRIDIRSPETLAEWRFEAEQPMLFDGSGGVTE